MTVLAYNKAVVSIWDCDTSVRPTPVLHFGSMLPFFPLRTANTKRLWVGFGVVFKRSMLPISPVNNGPKDNCGS
jgi:hypothetical protein